MTRHNLWPADLSSETDPTPADVLSEQARELETLTDGKLTGRVEVGSLGHQQPVRFWANF
jgi:hypothetical protein